MRLFHRAGLWVLFVIVFFSLAAAGNTPASVQTLEDIYGPTGKRFQAALGMLNFEKPDSVAPDPLAGYGVGVDDMVFSWKEINLIQDATECAPGGGQTGGSCAVIQLGTTNFFEGRALLTVSVLDDSPTVNNCNDNFACADNNAACNPFAAASGCGAGVACRPDYGDAEDDLDCNDNGVPDVRVEAQTEVELAPGEFVTLDCTDGFGTTCDSAEYRGTLPVSVAYDVPGVLFGAIQGGDLPTVLVTYLDNDDGTGNVCSNDVDPAAQGEVQTATALLVNSGEVVVNFATVVADDGDDDGFADTGERVTLAVSAINKTGRQLTNVVLRLASNDNKIDCILDTAAAIDSLAAGEERFTGSTGDNFVFRVSDSADRQAAGLDDLDDFSATFSVTVSADQIDSVRFPQQFVLDLDLDAVGGGVPDGGYFESFEVASGLGSFTTMNLDLGIVDGDPFANSQGWRCQYSDPDWVNSNSYGQITDCYVGATALSADAYDWRVHQVTDVDGGRAFSGSRSLYWGLFGAGADEHTTRMSVVEAVRMTDPVNLGATGNPELTMAHQVSLMDNRTVGARFGRVADRAIVQIQLADPAGNPAGDWIKLEPYSNLYDQQAEDNYTNCMFDPVDDGTTEDDFFDPSDPDRRLGPSSTCFPEQVFARMGNTFDAFNGDLGLAGDGPALPGTLGLGSWVESKFNLQRFRGRRIRVRFLVSSLKLGTNVNYEQLFNHNPDPGDDGWWIDSVRINNTIDAPAAITSDIDTPPGGPTCEVSGCTTVDAVVAVTPPGPLPAPGQAITIDASASTADACVDGTLQFRFLKNGSILLRDWTDNPIYLDAVGSDTGYTVAVRCSSAISCQDSFAIGIDVVNDGGAIGGGGGPAEAWVLNETSRSVSIVDVTTGILVGQVAIPGDPPWGIAFSTRDGHVGEEAYITQGSSLTRVDTPTRTLRPGFDIEAFTGYSQVRLKGIAAARLQTFDEGVRAYLHIAADVQPTAADALQPWFFVIDQDTLVGNGPFSLADDGPLEIPGVVADPAVMSWTFGPEFQRVWYTSIDPGRSIHAVRVASGTNGNWELVAGSAVSVASADAPANLVVGIAPPGRELALLPGGVAGNVTQLIPTPFFEGSQCSGLSGNNIREVAITGPGRNSFEIWVLDKGGDLRLYEENGPACDVEPIDVGAEPVALDSLGRVEFGKIVVANRADNTVRILSRVDENSPLQQQTVSLNPPPGGHGSVDVKILPIPAVACSVEDTVRFNSTNPMDPAAITWQSIGCGGGSFTVWLHEAAAGLARTEHDDWIDIDRTGGGSSAGASEGNYIIGSSDGR